MKNQSTNSLNNFPKIKQFYDWRQYSNPGSYSSHDFLLAIWMVFGKKKNFLL